MWSLNAPVAYELVVKGDVKTESFTDTWKTGFSVLLPVTRSVVITSILPRVFVYSTKKPAWTEVDDVVETTYFCCMCFKTKGGASGHVAKYSFSFRKFYLVVLTFIVALICLRG